MYRPQTGNIQYYQCINANNGQVLGGATFTMVSGVYFNTGGHWHNTNRPYSSVPGGTANANGVLTTAISTTLFSQAEKLTVTCSAGGYTSAPFNDDYAVGYPDIYWADHPELWLMTGGNTTGHGDNTFNHWMQANPATQTGPAYGLYNTANYYTQVYLSGGKICLNDMALPFGGKFDILQNWNVPAGSPHVSHDRGSAADTQTSTNQCQPPYNVVNPNQYLTTCVQLFGARPYPVSQVDPADVHCNWSDPATYPH